MKAQGTGHGKLLRALFCGQGIWHQTFRLKHTRLEALLQVITKFMEVLVPWTGFLMTEPVSLNADSVRLGQGHGR
jgi:hypothetical protein